MLMYSTLNFTVAFNSNVLGNNFSLFVLPTGIDKSDDDQTSSGRGSLQFYNASQISTKNGFLVIETTTEETKWKGFNPYKKEYQTMSRHFKSGMLQSWNKFCFTGGILEVDIQFPGRHDVGGLWPAVWLLGNLGRATFESSTNLMWPWSYGDCNRDMQSAQEISGCDVTQHYSLVSGIFRLLCGIGYYLQLL